MSSEHLLEVRDLKVEFDGEDGTMAAVEDVSFHVDAGETIVIVGESGSGKSVTSLAIMRLIADPPGRIASGSVHFHGKDGTHRNLVQVPMSTMRHIRGNDIAMIFQEPMTSLNPVYTVGDQIMEAIRLHQHKSRREAFALAVDMLNLMGIPEPRKRMANYPHQMSGGMRQRVMIAMALSCRPALLIADEPTTALDVTIQAQILELMKQLQREFGMAIVFITHDLGVAAEIADRIVVMYAGKIVEEGPVDAIFHHARMPYTIGLLNSVPRFDQRRGEGELLQAIPGTVPAPYQRPTGCTFHPRCRFSRHGICDVQVPVLEACDEPGHTVRCLRWREIAMEIGA